MRIRIETPIVVDGVPYAAGDEVDSDKIPAGCLASLLRLHQATQVTESSSPPSSQSEPEPEASEAVYRGPHAPTRRRK